MISNIYTIILKLKTPSEEGKTLDFQTETKNILEAANVFNEKYRVWNKRIIITEIDRQSISLILFVEKEKSNITPRELRSFTAYLYNDLGWSKYSREKSKLFAGISFYHISIDQTFQVIDEMGDNTLYHQQKDEIMRILPALSHKKNVVPELNTPSSLDFDHDHDLSDDQAMAIFNYLIETQDLGYEYQKKQETIAQIKSLLFEWT